MEKRDLIKNAYKPYNIETAICFGLDILLFIILSIALYFLMHENPMAFALIPAGLLIGYFIHYRLFILSRVELMRNEYPVQQLKIEDFYADDLRKIKRNEMGDLNWAVSTSKRLCEMTKTMKDNWIEKNPDYKPNKEVENLMNDVVVECMKISFKEEL